MTTRVNKRMIDGATINVLDFGADPTGLVDSTTAIQNALNAAGEESSVAIPIGDYLIEGTLTIPNRITLRGEGYGTILRKTNSGIVLNMDNVLYATLSDFNIMLDGANSTAIRVQSTNVGISFSQLNKFYNINVDGSNNTGVVGVFLTDTWSNQFYSCNIFRCTALVIGAVGDTDNSVNANHFYGCEIRGINTNTEHRPVNNRVGDNNGFFGGIIENWGKEISIGGGTFFLRGVYIEAFSTGRSIVQSGGDLIVDGCFRGPSVDFIDGDSLVFTNNQILDVAGSYKISFPFIFVQSNTDAFFTITGNHLDGSNDDVDFYLYREGEWFNGASWEDRTVVKEDVKWLPSRYSIRLAADQLDVTGDGTTYNINYGNNKEFDYGQETDNSGVFSPIQNGVYRLTAGVYLAGLDIGHRIELSIQTSDRTYYLATKQIESLDELINDTIILSGTCFANMKLSDTAVAQVRVSNGTKTVDVLRGNAVDAYTFFAGNKV